MLFLKTLDALLQLDIAWFAWLVSANIHWIFILIAITMLYLGKKKRILLFFALFTLLLYALGDFAHVALNWQIPGMVLFLVFVEKTTLEAFSNYKFVRENELLLGISFFIFFIAIVNIF